MSGLKGKIDYPLLKKSIIVELSKKDVEILERIITEITDIKHQEIMSVSGNSKLCKKMCLLWFMYYINFGFVSGEKHEAKFLRL